MKPFRTVRRLFMLTCEDVNDFLVAYLDGTLDTRTRARFERHIARCPQCRAYLAQYRETIALVQADGEPEPADPPDDLVELTLAFIRARTGDRP